MVNDDELLELIESHLMILNELVIKEPLLYG